MLGRIITFAAIVAAGYWYWSGPYQDRTNPSYEQRLEKNAEAMKGCVRAAAYKAGATGQVTSGSDEDRCAAELNLYQADGQWHSYDEVRPKQYQ